MIAGIPRCWGVKYFRHLSHAISQPAGSHDYAETEKIWVSPAAAQNTGHRVPQGNVACDSGTKAGCKDDAALDWKVVSDVTAKGVKWGGMFIDGTMFQMILPGSRFGLVKPSLGANHPHFSPIPMYNDEYGRTPGTENTKTQTAWFDPSWGKPDLRSANPLDWAIAAVGGFIMIGGGHNGVSYAASLVTKQSLCIAAVCTTDELCPTSVCYSTKAGYCVHFNNDFWPPYVRDVTYDIESNALKEYLEEKYVTCTDVELAQHKLIVSSK